MRLSKVELARRLGVSERSLSQWQREGLPVLEHGTRGHSNAYDVAAVIRWIKQTGRGLVRGSGGLGTNLNALERELALTSQPAAQAAGEDVLTYLFDRGAVRLAARLMNECGFTVELAIEIVTHVDDVFWSALADRYDVRDDDFGAELEAKMEPFYNVDDPRRPQLVDAIHKVAAVERAHLAPQLPLGGGEHV